MLPGPYGDWASRKTFCRPRHSLFADCPDYATSSLDRFYPETPLEETMGALIRRMQGQLYAGISSYSPDRTREAELLRACARRCPSIAVLHHAQRCIEAGG